MTTDRSITREKGLTLIEILVAMSIFAIIAVISYSGLVQFFKNRAMLHERTEQLIKLQTAMLLLEQDFRFAVARPVRNEYGDSEPMLVSGGDSQLAPGELVRFTTTRPDPELTPAQRLERVAWRIQDGKLIRISWRILDREQKSQELARTVLDEVDTMSMAFLQWSPELNEIQRGSGWLNGAVLPAGVELSLSMRSGNTYRRVLEIANGS